MKIAIYGAGSLGTILGAYLTKAGTAADLVNRNRAHIEALRKNGARVTGTVEFTVPVTALLPEEMTGPYDVIFLLTKQLDNENVVRFLAPFLSENGVICSMQNGIPEPLIASIIGAEKTLGCTIGWGATLLGPGVAELTSEPDHESLSFSLGRLTGPVDDTVREIKNILEIMGHVDIDENFMGARWTKLLINATFSGMATALGCTFGEVVDNKEARSAAHRVMKECFDTAKAAGIKLEPLQGKNLSLLFDYRGGLKRRIAFMLLPAAMKKHRRLKPSMLQDIENGKPTEVDAINGAVSRAGREAGVPTPFNDKTAEIIHAIEAGTIKPSMDNLARFSGIS
ncbi:ketopantoate reductase family protein [Breznakiella homolactica]|uniref:2-dehydropantoate 2-reductase n=1 Tax=Breznakiella homolactica TaxID=2798577 RepID=A0A7T8B8R5_9SPIR|nr:2-dehydropantoate 2-reductase [Breznakiella homolactica]QQO08884.1 2-dehydropantoate 2-reductase [Breznakiella homolactica]